MDLKLNANDKKLLQPILEEKLAKVKASTPLSDHKLAVKAYTKELVRMLKKINPKGHYWEN